MALNKKGVFFTFIALTFVSLLVLSTSIISNYEMRQKNFVIETRIDTTNKFLTDVEEDVERAIYISGYRSLVSMTEKIRNDGNYLSDIQANFNELFLNGTIEGENSSFMVNNTFNDWIAKISNESEKINILVDFSVNNITLSQDNPWKVKVDVDLGMNISDKENISRWYKENNITAYIEIDNLEDPVYLIETNGAVENMVRKTNFTYFVNGTNIDNLLNHTYEGYYLNHDDAPNYLQRLEGNIKGNSPYGIESLVDINELNSKGVPVKDKTIVDHNYFAPGKPNADHVQGAPAWFKIDKQNNHQQLYQVENITD